MPGRRGVPLGPCVRTPRTLDNTSSGRVDPTLPWAELLLELTGIDVSLCPLQRSRMLRAQRLSTRTIPYIALAAVFVLESISWAIGDRRLRRTYPRRSLVVDTRTRLPAYTGNTLSCSNCHLG